MDVSNPRHCVFTLSGQVSAEWGWCPGSMARCPRDSVALMQRSSAGWMPARIRMLSAGVGCRHPVIICKALLMVGSMRRVWALRHQTGVQYLYQHAWLLGRQHMHTFWRRWLAGQRCRCWRERVPGQIPVRHCSWVELSWFYLAINNIQLEKNKLVQGRQGIEGTRRLSSRCPSAVKLALFCPVSTCGGAYMWEGAARWSTQLRRGLLGHNRSLSVDGLLRSARTWAWQRKYKPS